MDDRSYRAFLSTKDGAAYLVRLAPQEGGSGKARMLCFETTAGLWVGSVETHRHHLSEFSRMDLELELERALR